MKQAVTKEQLLTTTIAIASLCMVWFVTWYLWGYMLTYEPGPLTPLNQLETAQKSILTTVLAIVSLIVVVWFVGRGTVINYNP